MLLPIVFAFIILIPCILFGVGLPVYMANFNNNPKVQVPSVKLRDMSDKEFNQWFAGFTDAEGCFYIAINNNDVTRFTFTIKLHKDDIGALEFIRGRLNCGYVYESGNAASFYLTKSEDIREKLIPLLDKFPLNGVKYLDYLAFKEAITLKSSENFTKSAGNLESITALKDSMNTKREVFEMPSQHTIRITPY